MTFTASEVEAAANLVDKLKISLVTSFIMLVMASYCAYIWHFLFTEREDQIRRFDRYPTLCEAVALIVVFNFYNLDHNIFLRYICCHRLEIVDHYRLRMLWLLHALEALPEYSSGQKGDQHFECSEASDSIYEKMCFYTGEISISRLNSWKEPV